MKCFRDRFSDKVETVWQPSLPPVWFRPYENKMNTPSVSRRGISEMWRCPEHKVEEGHGITSVESKYYSGRLSYNSSKIRYATHRILRPANGRLVNEQASSIDFFMQVPNDETGLVWHASWLNGEGFSACSCKSVAMGYHIIRKVILQTIKR